MAIPAGGGNRFSMRVSLRRTRRAPQARTGVRLPGGRRAVIPAAAGVRFQCRSKCPGPTERGRRRALSVCLGAVFAGRICFLFPPRVFFILFSSLFSIDAETVEVIALDQARTATAMATPGIQTVAGRRTPGSKALGKRRPRGLQRSHRGHHHHHHHHRHRCHLHQNNPSTPNSTPGGQRDATSVSLEPASQAPSAHKRSLARCAPR